MDIQSRVSLEQNQNMPAERGKNTIPLTSEIPKNPTIYSTTCR